MDSALLVCDICLYTLSTLRSGETHYCERLNKYICSSCYIRSNHDMYCADPSTPLRSYPSPPPSPVKVEMINCVSRGHKYCHIQQNGRVLLYCSRCALLTPVDHTIKTVTRYYNAFCISRSHRYHHVTESGHTIIYCRQCASQVPVTL